MVNKVSIPKRDKLEETECPLPDIYQKACKKIMHPDGWSCDDKCWRNIDCAMVTLGSITFTVDSQVKDFDYSALEPGNKTRTTPAPKPTKKPKKNLFDNW